MATTDLPTAVGHPFYARLNQRLREHGFDDVVEAQCARFYVETMGRPRAASGILFLPAANWPLRRAPGICDALGAVLSTRWAFLYDAMTSNGAHSRDLTRLAGAIDGFVVAGS